MGKIKQFFDIADSNQDQASLSVKINETPKMAILNSSFILSVKYNRRKKTLTIETKKGNYDYPNISLDVADGITVAPSPGKYYNQNIKNKGSTGKSPSIKARVAETFSLPSFTQKTPKIEF